MARRRAVFGRVPAAAPDVPTVGCGLLLAALLLTSLFTSPAQAHRTIRFLMAVPGTAADAKRTSVPLQAWLETALGHLVEPVSASDWESRLHVWSSTRPELVLADPVAFAACRASVTPGALIAIESRPYYAVMVAQRERDPVSLAALRGARIALGDRGSAVGHMQPLTMLDRAGLAPDAPEDVQLLHLEPVLAWKALTRGMVAAVAMEYAEFRARGGDEADNLTIIARGEPLPPDILFLDQGAGPEMAQRLEEALRRDHQGLGRALAATAERYRRTRIDWLADDGARVVDDPYVRAFALDGPLGPEPCLDRRAAP